MTAKPKRYWQRLQPTSLRHAMELCKDHARERLNKSMERVADDMGVSDHYALYKWIQSGRMPANLVRPFELACGINFVTRWYAASEGFLLVEIPTGRQAQPTDMVELNSGFAQALQLLTDFYSGGPKACPTTTLEALRNHLEQVAYHQRNVAAYTAPELEF